MKRFGAHRSAACFSLLTALFSASVALAQAQAVVVTDSDSPADTATDKAPGFSVHKEQRPVTDAFEDFERYRDKKAWEKAFGALNKIDEGKPGRLVPDKDGFFVPTELKVRAELLSLPPDGRQAYRLFNDAKAAQLLREASETNDLAPLRKLVNRYFITGIGDQAADQLGDALFEAGDFPNAERCWRMILDTFPDSAISPALLSTKRAIALARSEDWEALEAVKAAVHEKYAGQSVHIAGKDVVATEFVDALKSAASPRDITPGDTANATLTSTFVNQLPAGSELILPATDQPAWQIPLMDSAAADSLNTQLANSGWGAMSGPMTQAVPATVVDEKRIYINWLGICFAADITTGKLQWRTDTFGDMTQKMSQAIQQGLAIDPQIYGLTHVGDKLLCTRRSTDNQNYNELAMNRLLCLTAADGKAVWKSEQGPLAGWGMIGQPLVNGDQFYIVAHPPSSQELSLLCVNINKGDIRWQVGLGTPAATTNYRGMPTIPLPTLLLRSGKVMVLTNNGALLQIDIGAHQVDWSFSYPTYVQPQQNYYNAVASTPIIAPGAMLNVGPTLYFKEYNNNLLVALDASGPNMKWKRRIDPEAGIATFDHKNILLAGPEVECVDLTSRVLQWDNKTSIRTGAIQPLISGDWMYIFGSRGIESIHLSTGETGPVFRGYDRECDGGTIWKTSTRLVTISCRSITAYPLNAKTSATNGHE